MLRYEAQISPTLLRVPRRGTPLGVARRGGLEEILGGRLEQLGSLADKWDCLWENGLGWGAGIRDVEPGSPVWGTGG